MTQRDIFFSLGLVTLLGFGLIGVLVIHLATDYTFADLFRHGVRWYLQIPLGLLYGIVCGAFGWLVVRAHFMNNVRSYYQDVLRELDLTFEDILYISLCAGIGEELLFRGAVQHFLGIWPTSVLFVAIHGYLNPLNWRLSVYGIFMVVAIAGVGYLFNQAGMLTAMSAHFAIDVFLLWMLVRKSEK